MIRITDNKGMLVYEGAGPLTLSEAAAPPPPDPDYIATIEADRTTITAGETVKLTMRFERVHGAWLIANGKETPLAGPVFVVEDKPAASTQYTLRVQITKFGDPSRDFAQRHVFVTVNPAPKPPPPPANTKAGIGVHILTNVRGWEMAFAQGCRVGLFMNRPDEACQYATIDPLQWTPESNHCLIMYRIFHDPNPWSSDDMVAQLAGLTDNPNPNKKNVIITLANEWDNGVEGAGNSAAGMAKFCDWTIECVQKLRAKGFRHIAWLTSSMGTPNFVDPDLCNVIKQKIAPLWNRGDILWTDMHLYSPDPGWIYKGIVKSAYPYAPEFPVLQRGAVGRDGHEATWIAYAPVEAGYKGAMEGLSATTAFNDAPTAQWWFEERWRFLYTRCGFSPTAPGRIVSSEMGLDEGGIGGFPAHGMNREQVNAYLKRFIELQQQPLVIDGVSYPSPFVAGAVFQGDPDDGRWQGYRVPGYYPLPWRL